MRARNRGTLATLLIALLGAELCARQGPGVPRPGVGPGQGPQAPYQELNWRYFWWLNHPWMIDLRPRLGIEAGVGRISDAALPSVVTALTDACQDKDPDVRAAARIALAKTGDERAAAVIAEGLRDGSLTARRAAVLALGVLGRSESLARLHEIVLDDGWETRERATAAVALGFIDQAERPDLALAAYSRDATRVAGVFGDGSLRVFRTDDGAEERRLEPPAPLSALAFAGDVLIAGARDGSVVIADLSREAVDVLEVHAGAVVGLAVDPDQRAVTTAGDDHRLCRVDLRRRRVLAERTLDRGITAIDATDDALWIATDEPAVWILPSMDGDPSVTIPLEAPARKIRAFADGRRVLIASESDGASIAWLPDGDDSAAPVILRPASPDAPTAIVVDPTGQRVVIANRDGAVRVHDVATGDEVTSFRSARGPARALWFDTEGVTRVALADGSLRRLDARIGTTLDRLATAGVPTAVAWSERADQLATGDGDGGIHLWDAGSRDAAGDVLGHSAMIRSLAWDPRGERLASVSGDGELLLQSVRRRQLLHRIPQHEGAGTCVTWSRDGRQVATGGDDGAVILRLANQGTEIGRITAGAEVNAVRWSPRDPDILAVATAAELALWDAKERIRRAALRGHEGAVVAIDWTQDGARLASLGADGWLRVWDVDSGRPRCEVAALPEPGIAVAFVNDDRQLVTTAVDGSVRLFDAENGAEIAGLSNIEGAGAIAVAPDHESFAVVADDAVHLFDARNGMTAVHLQGRSARAIFRDLIEPRRYASLDNPVQAGVAIGVGLTQDPTLAPEVELLLDKTKRDRSAARAHLTGSLGRLGDRDRVETLASLLSDKDTQVRRSAALALGALMHGTGDPAALKALDRREGKESDQIVKAFLGVAMARVGGAAATRSLYPKIVESRKSGNPGVIGPPRISLGGFGREQFAAISLGILGNPNVSPTLLSRFQDSGDLSIRGADAIALGLIGDQRTAPALLKELRDTGDPILRGELSVALGLLRHTDAIPVVEEFVADENNPELLTHAALGLALLDRPRANAVVKARLAQSDGDVDRALLFALGIVGDEDAFTTALDRLRDPRQPGLVRAYAAVALGNLADRSPRPKLDRLRADFNYTAEVELMLTSGLLMIL